MVHQNSSAVVPAAEKDASFVKRPAFEVDNKVRITLKYDLCERLAKLIVDSGTEDKQLQSLAYEIVQ